MNRSMGNGLRPVRGTVRAVSRQLAIIGGLVFLGAMSLIAQNAELQQKLAAVKRSVIENKQRLQRYQWYESVQLTLKGDPKPASQNLCRYAPDGTVQKTPIGPPPPPPSGGRLKQKIVANKKAEMQDYMGDVKNLLALYVPPDPQKMQQAYQSGNFSLNPVGGMLNLIFANYAQPNDKLTVTFDQASKKITALHVNTYMGEAKDVVTLDVTMSSLPDGTSFVLKTVLNATAKQLVVTTINSNYEKLAAN
jgi:hypothetical protein